MEDSYHLFESNFIWQDLRKTTDLWSKKWPNKSLTRNQLSWKIYAISECLDIDPIVFSSLIYSESAFKISAVSRTKAVGLTQFTSIGIVEVNDQFGHRGKSYALANTDRIFQYRR